MNYQVQSELPLRYFVKVKPVGERIKNIELSGEDIVELAREYLRTKAVRMSDSLTQPSMAQEKMADWLLGCEREEFAVMLLDSQHRCIHIESLFQGTINAAPVYPREVVKLVCKHNAAAVILAHNHPSGVADPSQADHRVTERLKKALNLIDVALLDHFVIGNGETVSFAERGLL